jgi:DNA replication protein DnaC
MNITETENKELKISHIEMDCDHILNKNFVPPLDSFLSGFCFCLVGPSGSGKTNYLVSLINTGKKKGKQRGFRNCFSNICIISPSMHTIKKNNPFEDLRDEWKYEELTVENLENFEALCEEAQDEAIANDEELPFNLLILDDCGTTIRKNKQIENKFNQIVANRRHKYRCSIIMLLQYTTQIPPSIRSNLTHLVSFMPKSYIEKENIFTTWTGLRKNILKNFMILYLESLMIHFYVI